MYSVAFVVFLVLFTIPPAAKVLTVAVAVYAILQALKKAPWFTQILKGWTSVAFNVVFTALSIVVITPIDQLYTINTLTQIISAIGTSAGIHGTVTLMKQQAEQKAAQEPPTDSDSQKNG